MNSFLLKRRGFGLVEIVVASAILSVVMIDVFNLFQASRKTSKATEEENQVNYLLEEGVEALKSFRDISYSANFNNFSTTTPYSFRWDSVSNSWASTTAVSYIDSKYIRTFSISDVKRDTTTHNIATTGTTAYDPDVKLATVSTTWYSQFPGGVLSPLNPVSVAVGTGAGTYGAGPVISPDGKYVYTTHDANQKVYWFSRDFTTGKLTAAGNISTGVDPRDIAISPDGTSVYVANYGLQSSSSGSITQYTRNASTGALSGATTYTISSTSNPTGVAVSADGLYVYVSQQWDQHLVKYNRSLSTGALTGRTYESSHTGGGCTAGLVVSPDNTSLYATGACWQAGLDAFTRNISTGGLTYIGSQPVVGTMGYNYAFAFSPDAAFLYIPNSLQGVSMYRRDSTTGALTLLSPSSINTGYNLLSAAVSPDGYYIYVTIAGGIYQFSRDVNTGQLTPLSPATVMAQGGNGLPGVIFSPDGSSVYATDGWSPSIYQFSRNPGATTTRSIMTYITNIFSN